MLMFGVFLVGLAFGCLPVLLLTAGQPPKELAPSPLQHYEVDGHLRAAWFELDSDPGLALRHAERAVELLRGGK